MKRSLCSRLSRAVLPLLAALAPFTPNLRAGTHVWAGGNYLWSNPGNWSSGGAPQVGEAAPVILVFPAAGVKSTTNDLPGLVVDGLQITGDNYAFGTKNGASFQFRGDWQVPGNGIAITNATARLYGDVTIAGQTHFTGWNSTLVFNGAIGGSGWLSLEYINAEFTGTQANTFSGLLWLQYGELRLNKTNATAIAGKLAVGTPSGLPDTGRVRLNRADQISNSSEVDVSAGGWLNLNGFSDAVGELKLMGGRITTGAGTLSFTGNLSSYSNAQPAVIEGQLSLGLGSRTITVEDGPALEDLWIKADVSGIANFTKLGAGLMTLSGNNTFSSTLRLNEGTLLAQSSTALGGSLGSTYVTNNATLLLFPTTYPNNETLHVAGNGWQGQGAVQVVGVQATATWQGPIVLASNATFLVPSNSVLVAAGVLSGPGGFTLEGGGELTLSGSSPNTHTGTNLVSEGKLWLSKSPNVATFAGKLVIGDGFGGYNADRVGIAANGVIPATASVQVNGTGLLKLGQFDLAPGALALSATANVQVDAGGVLTLPSLVRILPNGFTNVGGIYSPGRIHGNGDVFLAGPTTFDAEEDPTTGGFEISSRLSGNDAATLTKTGLGGLTLSGDNTYAGLTVVQAGFLEAVSQNPLGSAAAGTIVTNLGALGLRGVTGPEPLIIASDATNPPAFNVWSSYSTFAGPITLHSDLRMAFAGSMPEATFSGAISGPGGIILVAPGVFTSPGTLLLAGNASNTYGGQTRVDAGTLQLAKTNALAVPGTLVIGDGVGAVSSAAVQLLSNEQIQDVAAVTINADGALDLNNFAEFIGSLAGSGRVFCQTNELVTGANDLNTVWSGGIQGNGPITLTKVGLGTMQITGDNYYSGKTTVQGGWLDVRGSLPSSHVQVYNTGKLMGTGAVGSLQNFNGGTTSPGANIGTLHSGNLTMAVPGTYRIELDGAQADQLDVIGTVNVAGTLQVLPTNASPVGTTFVILANDGADAVTGTFTGLPQNAEFIAGGQRFRISYTGGDGNDVVLTHVNTPPSFTSVTATAFASEGGTVHLDGMISDPDTADTFALVVNWGDGSAPQTFNFPAGSTLIHVEHVYADDKPGAQPSDNFTIEYTLTDTSGSPAFGQLNTVIGNVAPSFGALGSVALKSGQPLNTTVNFTDPGADTWTATLNYGDGSGTQPLAVGPGCSLVLDHAFPTNGTYTVTLNVSDDDTGTGSSTLTVYAGLELAIARSTETGALVSWPGIFPGFTLQSSPVLPGTNWTTVAGAPVLHNDTWQLTVPSTNGNVFFRLVK